MPRKYERTIPLTDSEIAMTDHVKRCGFLACLVAEMTGKPCTGCGRYVDTFGPPKRRDDACHGCGIQRRSSTMKVVDGFIRCRRCGR